MRYLIIITLSFLMIFCSSPQTRKHEKGIKPEVQHQYRYLSEFKKYLATSLKDTSFPGAGVVIVKGSQILYIKGLGVKKITEPTDSVNIHTVFRIASVSKGFASVLTGIFVYKGLLKWDDKVVTYLPGFKLQNPTYTNQLTVRHLLSQTTGLPRHTFTNMIEQGIEYPVLRDKLVEVPLTAAPGEVHSYQNVAYSVISDILEKITGKTYGTLLKEYIFIPLKMNDASTTLAELEKSPDHAFPHIVTRKGFLPVKNTNEYYSYLPAAGINASISDLGNWLKALLGSNPEILKPEMLKEVFAPEIETPRRRKYSFMRWMPLQKSYYAMGWRVLIYNHDTLLYHGGGVKGFRAEIAFSPAHKIGIAVICNAPGKFINNTVPAFFDLFYKYHELDE